MSKDAVSQDKLLTEAIKKEERFEFKEFRPFQQHRPAKDLPANPAKVDPSAHFKKVAADILARGTSVQEATVPQVRKEKFGYETSSNSVGSDWKKALKVQKEFERYSKPRSTCEVRLSPLCRCMHAARA